MPFFFFFPLEGTLKLTGDVSLNLCQSLSLSTGCIYFSSDMIWGSWKEMKPADSRLDVSLTPLHSGDGKEAVKWIEISQKWSKKRGWDSKWHKPAKSFNGLVSSQTPLNQARELDLWTAHMSEMFLVASGRETGWSGWCGVIFFLLLSHIMQTASLGLGQFFP